MPFRLPFLLPLHVYVVLRFLVAPWLGRAEIRALRVAAATRDGRTGDSAPGGSVTDDTKLGYYRRFCLGNLISGTACWALWSLLPAMPLHWGTVMGASARGFVEALAIGGGIGGVLGEGIELLLLRRKQSKYKTKRRELLAAKMYQLPATPTERRWWFAVSCMAGYGEELTYRAFLIAYLALVVSLNAGWVLLISSLLFGFAHLGQGIRSAITTTIFGCLFGMAYLGTGHLWYAMLLHALFNLRLLPELRMVELMQSEPATPEAGASATPA